MASDDFDPESHVVGVDRPPVDDAGLRELVADLFAQRRDRRMPLWRIDVAELQEGGRALIWRLHHALADGTTAIRLARAVLSTTRTMPESSRRIGRLTTMPGAGCHLMGLLDPSSP